MSLAGCAVGPQKDSPAIAVQTQKVNIAVPLECKVPPARDLPKLAISDLTKESSDKDTATAYDRTVQDLTAEIKWYRTVLYPTPNSDVQGK